jgi:hypothetical protein
VRVRVPVTGGTVFIVPCNQADATFEDEELTLYYDGTVRIGDPGSNLCLDLPNSNTTDGTYLQVYPCTGGANQQFQWNPDNTLHVLSKCVDLPGGNTAEFTRLDVWDCNGGANQKFDSLPATEEGATSGLLLRSWANQTKCIDVEHGSTANGTPIDLYDCHGTNNQVMQFYEDGTIRVMGKCLDVPHGNSADGTLLDLWDCHGGPNQTFVWAADDTIQVLGKCLDLPHGNTSNLTPIELYDCHASPNQRWTWSAGSTSAPISCASVAAPVNPAAATVNSSLVFHLYWGTSWASSDLSYAINQLNAWNDILQQTPQGSPFFWPLWQYAIPAGTQINGTFDYDWRQFNTALTGIDWSGNTVLNAAQVNAEVLEEAKVVLQDVSLPAGVTPVYIVYLPPNVLTTAMVGTGTIGYHGQATDLFSQFAIIKYQSQASATAVESHELVELITNPNSDPSLKGWHLNGEELVDVCEDAAYPTQAWTTNSGNTYQLARFWSNDNCLCYR